MAAERAAVAAPDSAAEEEDRALQEERSRAPETAADEAVDAEAPEPDLPQPAADTSPADGDSAAEVEGGQGDEAAPTDTLLPDLPAAVTGQPEEPGSSDRPSPDAGPAQDGADAAAGQDSADMFTGLDMAPPSSTGADSVAAEGQQQAPSELQPPGPQSEHPTESHNEVQAGDSLI